MALTEQKIPESNPMLKLSIGSVISNPLPDDELLTIEGDKKLNMVLICIVVDIFMILFVILQEYDFLVDGRRNDILLFFIKTIICILLLGFVMFLFCLHRLYSAQIARFGYLFFGSIYFIFKFIQKIIKLANEIDQEYEENEQSEEESEEDIDIHEIDIIFLFVNLVTIIPRILAFLFSRGYVEKLKKIRRIKKEIEHENFVEKIAARIEKGYTRWSNPNASMIMDFEPQKKQFFDKKENDDDNDNNIDDENENVLYTVNGNKMEEENYLKE